MCFFNYFLRLLARFWLWLRSFIDSIFNAWDPEWNMPVLLTQSSYSSDSDSTEESVSDFDWDNYVGGGGGNSFLFEVD